MSDKEYMETVCWGTGMNEYEEVVFDDGKIVVYTTSEDEEEKGETIYEWEMKNLGELEYVYEMLRGYAIEEGLLEEMMFTDFVEYMYNAEDEGDEYEWNEEVVREYAEKFGKRKRPEWSVWIVHYLKEIFEMYGYVKRNTCLKMGGFEGFARFAFNFSKDEIK